MKSKLSNCKAVQNSSACSKNCKAETSDCTGKDCGTKSTSTKSCKTKSCSTKNCK